MVSVDAVAALQFLVIYLGLEIALRADTTDKVECREAATGPDGGVPYLIGLASSSADAVSGIISLSRRTDTAAVSNEIVSRSADALAIHPLFIAITSLDALSQISDVSAIADTLLGGCGVSRIEGTG